jgi:hypothetical protein
VQQVCLGHPLVRRVRDIDLAERKFFGSTYRRFVVTGVLCRWIAWISFCSFTVVLALLASGRQVPDWASFGLLGLFVGMGACAVGVRVWPHDKHLRLDRKAGYFELYGEGERTFLRCPYSGLILTEPVRLKHPWARSAVSGLPAPDDRYPVRVDTLPIEHPDVDFRPMSDAERKEVQGLVRCGLVMWAVLVGVLAVLSVLGVLEVLYRGSGFSFLLPGVFAVWMGFGMPKQYWEAARIVALRRDLRRGQIARLDVTDAETRATLEVLPSSFFLWSVDGRPADWRILRPMDTVG